MCATVASIGTASRSAHADSLIYALFMAKRPNPTGHANNGEIIALSKKACTSLSKKGVCFLSKNVNKRPKKPVRFTTQDNKINAMSVIAVI